MFSLFCLSSFLHVDCSLWFDFSPAGMSLSRGVLTSYVTSEEPGRTISVSFPDPNSAARLKVHLKDTCNSLSSLLHLTGYISLLCIMFVDRGAPCGPNMTKVKQSSFSALPPDDQQLLSSVHPQHAHSTYRFHLITNTTW